MIRIYYTPVLSNSGKDQIIENIYCPVCAKPLNYRISNEHNEFWVTCGTVLDEEAHGWCEVPCIKCKHHGNCLRANTNNQVAHLIKNTPLSQLARRLKNDY